MSTNPFSMLGLVAALDDRNIQAHPTDTVADCTVCATVSGPVTDCPADRVAEITRTAQHPLAATDIVDHLGGVGYIVAS